MGMVAIASLFHHDVSADRRETSKEEWQWCW